MTDTELLAVEVAAVDERITVEWVRGVCVLHAPKDLPTCAEVRALRLVEAYTPQFVFRTDPAC